MRKEGGVVALSQIVEKTIQRLISNDQAAYKELVDTYGEKLLRLAYMVVGDRQLAEDVVQESFLAIYQHVHSFRAESSFDTWVTRITLNKAKNKIRPSMWKRIICFREVRREDDHPLPHDEYEARQQKKWVHETMFALPLKYRDVHYLYYFEEMKIREIADALNVSESGIKSRLKRGREKMKILLEARGVGLDE